MSQYSFLRKTPWVVPLWVGWVAAPFVIICAGYGDEFLSAFLNSPFIVKLAAAICCTIPGFYGFHYGRDRGAAIHGYTAEEMLLFLVFRYVVGLFFFCLVYVTRHTDRADLFCLASFFYGVFAPLMSEFAQQFRAIRQNFLLSSTPHLNDEVGADFKSVDAIAFIYGSTELVLLIFVGVYPLWLLAQRYFHF